MSERLAPLTGEAVEELPAACRACLFWELGRPRPDPRHRGAPDELAGDALTQKQAFAAAQAVEGAAPGRVLRRDDKVVAYALFAPPGGFAPRKAPVPATSEDALLLATVWIEPHHRGEGLGRLLIRATLRDALRRELAAVEAYGDRRFREQECVLPATWLLREGFEVHREHPRYPLLRLDLDRTVRWAETLEQALEEMLGHLPSGRAQGAPGQVAGAGTDSGTVSVAGVRPPVGVRPRRNPTTASDRAPATTAW